MAKWVEYLFVAAFFHFPSNILYLLLVWICCFVFSMWSLKSFFGWADNGHDKTVWRLFFAIMTHFMALKIKGQHHQFYASVRLQLLWSTTAYVRTVPLEVDVWNPKNCHECSRGGRESSSSLLNGELWCFAFFLF